MHEFSRQATGTKTHARARKARAGFTLLEVSLALALMAILLFKGVSIMRTASDTTTTDTTQVVLEDKAQELLERIARAVMGSERETLAPDQEAPNHQDVIQYKVHLGIEDGEVVWSDPEEIGREDTENAIYWSQEAANERRVVWTKLVSPYLEGEIPNGMDDNGNGPDRRARPELQRAGKRGDDSVDVGATDAGWDDARAVGSDGGDLS